VLRPGEVLVWRAMLDRVPPDKLPPLLPEESERAGRFRSDEARRRYICSHGILRAILAGLGLPPAFQRDAMGKPYLPGFPAVHFNLSRSHGMALYAVALGALVGADIEKVRPLPECLAIAERFTPPTDFAALREMPAEARERQFFRVWTRQEAKLKALGIGLLGARQDLAGEWSIEEIDVGESFVAAVAAPAPGYRAVFREFEVTRESSAGVL